MQEKASLDSNGDKCSPMSPCPECRGNAHGRRVPSDSEKIIVDFNLSSVIDAKQRVVVFHVADVCTGVTVLVQRLFRQLV